MVAWPMKRFVAGVVCLALILVTPPPSAWAQMAEAARSIPALSLSPLGAPSLNAAPAALNSAFLQAGLRPIELVAPALAVAAVPVSAAAPGASENSPPAARVELVATARALGAVDARPAVALERLFTGDASRTPFADDSAAAPAVHSSFGTGILKRLMRAKPADEKSDPEIFAIMKRLREKINARRRAQGKMEIPMPEIVDDPLPLPNVYSTGRDPFHALVGVTAGIKEMTLDPENIREGVARLIANSKPGSKAFKAFRLAVAGSIAGVTELSPAADIQAAVLKADRLELKALGARVLTAVLAREFSRATGRRMLSTAIVGAVSSSIALASHGAMRWAPAIVRIVQTASSRNVEGKADEDGALLCEDPQALALALGMLAAWQPRPGFLLSGASLPGIAAASFLMTVNPIQQAASARALPELGTAAFDRLATHPDTSARIEKLSSFADALRAAKPSRPPETVGAPVRQEIGSIRGAWEKLKRFYRVLPDEGRNRAFWAFTLGQSLATLGMDFHYTALPNLVAPTKADNAKLGYNRATNWGAQAAGSLMTGPFVDRQPVKRTLVWTYVGRAVLMALVPVLFATGHFGFAAFCLLIAVAGFLQSTGGTAGSVAFNRILGDDEAYYNRANAIMTIVTNVVGVVGPLLAGAFIAWAGSFFVLPLMGSALSYGVYAVLLLATGVGYGLLLKIPRDEMLQARRDLKTALKAADLGGARVKGVGAKRSADGRQVLVVELAGVEPSLAKGVPAEFAGYPVVVEAPRRALRELVDGFKLTWSNSFLRRYLTLSTLSLAAGDSLVFAVMPRYLADVLKAGPGAFGLFLAAAALGVGVASGVTALLKDPAQAALSPVAVEFRATLAARDRELSAGELDRAAAAVRGSLNEVLERYKTEWRAGRGRARGLQELGADVLAESAAELGRVLKASPEEAVALLEATGAARDVRLWAARRGARYVESARRDAKSGMDSLQRQGKWSNLLHAASWVAYAGVFFVHALWPSVALMLVSALLAGPGNIIWSSLTTRVVAGSFANDQGKVYSAMTFYMLAASVIGVLGLGWMMAAVPTATGLLVAGGILLACTVFDLILTFAVFPLKRP